MDSAQNNYPNVSIYSRILKSQFLQSLRIGFYFVDSILIFLCDAMNVLHRTQEKKEQQCKKKVLIIFNLALGDSVMFLAAAEAYRTLFPKEDYTITVTCQKQNKELFSDTFDSVIPLDFVKGCVSLVQRFKNYRILRSDSFDIAIDPVGCADCTTNIFTTKAARASTKIGILDNSIVKYSCPKWIQKSIYSKIYRIEEQNLHRIPFYLKIPEIMTGKSFTPHPYEFPAIETVMDAKEDYFIIFPSASLRAKRWSPEHFARIAERMHSQLNIRLLVCGTEKDKKDIDDFLCLLKKDIPVTNVVGQTSIKDFIEIIGKAKCIVTNDTSVFHIAIAKNVPVFVIAGGFSYGRFTNYEQVQCRQPVLIFHKRECFNCNNYCTFSFKDTYPCIDEISVEYAWNIIEPKLNSMKENAIHA